MSKNGVIFSKSVISESVDRIFQFDSENKRKYEKFQILIDNVGNGLNL